MNDGGIESLKETINLYYAPTIKPKSDIYALIIGVSNYKDTLIKLRNSVKDGQILSGFLNNRNPDKGKVYVKTLFNKEAKKDSILKAKEFLMNSKINDEVILYISGYGLLDKKYNYYFGAYDLDRFKPSKTALSLNNLENLLDGVPAAKKIIFINTNNSSEVNPDEMKQWENINDPCLSIAEHRNACLIQNYKELQKSNVLGFNNSIELMNELFVDLSKGSGAVVISSSAGMYEYSYDSIGVFTYAIMDALTDNKAAKNNDNNVSISELKDYVIEKVKQLTNDMQKPTARKENFDFDFQVW